MLWDILCKHSEENHALNTDEIIAFLAEKNIAVLLQDIALLNEYGYWKHFSGVFIIKSAIIIIVVTTTLLANSVTPTAVYDLEAKLDGYMILDPHDVNMAAEIIYKKIIEVKDKNQLRFYQQRAEKKLKEYDLMKQIEIMAVVRHFIGEIYRSLREEKTE